MNPFNQKLQKAQSSQRKTYAWMAGLLVAGSLVVATVVATSTGTSIEIRPREAKDAGTVRVVSGVALALDDVVYGFSQTSQIDVSAPGFKATRRNLGPDQKGKTLEVRLEELPARLVASTEPENETTRWFMDGKRVSISPELDLEVPAGTYQMQVDHPYFETVTRDIVLARGEDKSLSLKLPSITGLLKVNTIPEGAEVLVNGQTAGASPLSLEKPGGKYTVAVSKEGYRTTTENIEITNTARTLERTYRLLPEVSTLVFRLSPAGGNLIVNGTRADPGRAFPADANVETTVLYSLSGFKPQSRQLIPKAGETHTIRMDLEPDLGIVEVNAKPRARVLVNGKDQGQTPQSLKLPAKRHVITLTRTGYRGVEREVVPTSKRTITINAILRPEPVARLEEAPQSYVNDLGMGFKLFQPSPFEMGGARHEKGQRANEFQRQIVLEKPFYAATHEVTVGQFKAFQPSHAGSGGNRYPVTSVSWDEAAAFCNWLSEKENLPPFYEISNGKVQRFNNKSNGYRLLTEPEWEWLARRAGRKGQSLFPWGNTSVVPARTGNIADETAKGLVPYYVPNYTDGFAEVAPVGSFAPEPSGLFDITGNVSEWVNDVYSLQPPASNLVEVDPLKPTIGSNHVIKGSSWRSGTRTTLRAAYRDGLLDRRNDVGFRIGRYL